LIHAATMVAAGVYLVARTLPLFTSESLQVVLAIGLTTHLLAGTVALTQTDIKRVLAYSTLSQLGLMMTALGLGARSAAMLHLVTHACFKALLFLAAGSVIHAAHEQDLSRLGGLRKAMPWTAALFLLASLSMGGTFLLSGFWSKDAILLAAGASAPWLLWALLLGAAMTAGYIFRLYLLCFEGEARHHGDHHAHARPGHPEAGGRAGESPAVMVLPMAALGVGAALVGLVESPWLGHPFLRLLGDPHVHEHIDAGVAVLSTGSLALGVWLAWMVGFKRRTLMPAPLRPLALRLYRLAANKYYVDELYGRVMIRPFLSAAEWLSRFDQRVIDAAVNGTGWLGAQLGALKERFDRLVVDRLVNAIAETVRGLGAFLRRLQTGIVHQYLLVVVVAVIVLSLALRR
jgi:NADH-quinone oxidoreductase subunit L